ncbi:cell adhesion molecule 2-like [Mytilus trossulus]|uniref:cell adhesion molecule 2-like n=1 Tax=Mytilus trossulus TaxID=6551 RepID=UPI003005C611
MIIFSGLYADQSTIIVTTNGENIATDYGKSITLTCDVSVICMCFVKSIEWYKGKNKIKCCRDNTTKYEFDKNHLELTIKDVDKNDLGDYTCVLDTIFFTYTSKDIEVVYALPKIVVTTQLIEILKNGESIELSCNISSRYKTISVNWFKGSDKIIENRKKYQLKGNNQNILCIHDVKVCDSGTYKCRVDNEKGRNESEGITVVYSISDQKTNLQVA